MPEAQTEAELKIDLAAACRILAANGQGDAIFGHVSGRLPGWDRFWMKPTGLGLEEIRPEHLILVDFDGTVIDGTRPRHEEYPIHTEIMRARPDVLSVVHTHPKYSIAFAARGGELRPISHEGSLFWPPGVATFDEFTDLVRTREQGDAVARALGDRRAIFLLNHGIAVAGPTIAEACYSALLLERATEIQLLAEGRGETAVLHTPLEEAREKGQRVFFPARTRAVFDYYARQAPDPHHS